MRKYGLIPRVIRFDGNEREDIYPTIEGLTKAKVREGNVGFGSGGTFYLPGDDDPQGLGRGVLMPLLPLTTATSQMLTELHAPTPFDTNLCAGGEQLRL